MHTWCISVLYYLVNAYLLLRCIVLEAFHLRHPPPPHPPPPTLKSFPGLCLPWFWYQHEFMNVWMNESYILTVPCNGWYDKSSNFGLAPASIVRLTSSLVQNDNTCMGFSGGYVRYVCKLWLMCAVRVWYLAGLASCPRQPLTGISQSPQPGADVGFSLGGGRRLRGGIFSRLRGRHCNLRGRHYDFRGRLYDFRRRHHDFRGRQPGPCLAC